MISTVNQTTQTNGILTYQVKHNEKTYSDDVPAYNMHSDHVDK